MPVNSFSIGHDVAVDMIDPILGTIVILDAVTGFSAESQTKQITSEPLNGPPQFAETFNGWKGQIDFDRKSHTADAFFQALEDNYWNGINTLSGTITQTITEPNGVISQWKYVGATFKFGDAGKWKAQEKVAQKIDWMASQRKRIV
jgi:hypothetical protein